MKKYYALLIAVAVISFLFSYAAMRTGLPKLTGQSPRSKEAEDVLYKMRYIAHAGGAVHAANTAGEEIFIGSNSREALMKCRDDGRRAIELDFNFTSDGELVCIHDWSARYADDITDGKPLTLDNFLKCRIYGCLTSLWLGDVADFLRKNDGFYVITDIKDDNVRGARVIAESYPDLLARFIIQIYSEDEYEAVRGMGFSYIIYTLYRLDWESKADVASVIGFAGQEGILAVAFPRELMHVPGYAAYFVKSGIPALVHTVNEREEMLILFASGAWGVYTDTSQ